jgi:hypothetical protein
MKITPPKFIQLTALLLIFFANEAAGQNSGTVNELDPGISIAIDLSSRVRLDFFGGREKYLDMEAAITHCTKGISIWSQASNDQGQEPDEPQKHTRPRL